MSQGTAPARPSALILTGGQSRRMGRDKALLEVAGRPLLTLVAEQLASCCGSILAADPHPQRLAALGIHAVADPVENGGPLAGLEAGLRAAPSDPLLLVGCDMPGFQPAVLALLLARLGDADAAVAVIEGRLQPLGALYRKRVVTRIPELRARMPRAGLRDLLSELQVECIEEQTLREVDPELESFLNLNRPEDYERFQARFGRDAGADGSS